MTTGAIDGKWELARFSFRALLLILFTLMVIFWLSVIANFIGSLVRGGWHEASAWLLHIAGRPWDSMGLQQTPPRWKLVAARFSVWILVSIGVWLANRKAIRDAIANWRRNA